MHWNYRIVRRKDDGSYGLHEVYYEGKDGEEISWTVDAVCFVVDNDEGPEGLIAMLEQALKDAKSSRVFDEATRRFD